ALLTAHEHCNRDASGRESAYLHLPHRKLPQEKREDRSYLRPIIFYRDETGVCLSAASIRCRLSWYHDRAQGGFEARPQRGGRRDRGLFRGSSPSSHRGAARRTGSSPELSFERSGAL